MERNQLSFRRARRNGLAASLFAAVGLALLGACNGGTGSGASQVGVPGREETKPGSTETFFVDENQGGGASRLRIARLFWGRLVDVHDIEAATGEARLQPLFRDFVINENILSDGLNYVIETNPITQNVRLVIQRDRTVDPSGFDLLLRNLTENMPPISPASDTGTGTFSFISRNATLVIRFDDVLDDSTEAELNLPETVNLQVGYPPNTPFSARMLFDPNYGAIIDGGFHSTRLLIDMTVSESEASTMVVAAPINSLGLPASLEGVTQISNVSVRIPSRVDVSSGQFDILTNYSGAPMATKSNGPVDVTSSTQDVVRAMRAGNSADTNNGFLLDLNLPEALGGWPMAIGSAVDAPGGQAGFDFILIPVTFTTPCRARPEEGDILQVNGQFVEVTEPASEPDVDGVVAEVRVRLVTADPLTTPGSLVGPGIFLSTFDPNESVSPGCWVSFTPVPGSFPATDIATNAQVLVRFSEPMDPDSITAFGTYSMIRGLADTEPDATNTIVGRVLSSPDLRDFTFDPILELSHTMGSQEDFHMRIVGGLEGVTDLAGNPLRNPLPSVEFSIDPLEETQATGGIVFRFERPDEVPPFATETEQNQDLRGQFFYDLSRGVVKPRPVTHTSYPADRNNPVPSIMIPFARGVQTPLSPLGSKMHTVWRYADFGWQVEDETVYNLDVEGLNWSPIGGQVVADFYEEFEIRLAHSRFLPDEYINRNLLPAYPSSGLISAPSLYTDNILPDPLSPQKVVHNRALGYRISPIELFLTPGGTFMIPFPLNQNSSLNPVTYLWRDTAIRASAGANGAGVPMAIETQPPLSVDSAPSGRVAPSGAVPSFGLPLLMEFRCYPSDSGVGLNAFDISLAVNSSAQPNFRSFSTGGINTAGVPVMKNPDLELSPTGGFNPSSTPVPGARTLFNADNTFYVGQLDVVVRTSRIHTLWVDTGFLNPIFEEPVVEPASDRQPDGTRAIVEFRGADGFTAEARDFPFRAERLNPYGNPTGVAGGGTTFITDGNIWAEDITTKNGAQYFQARISFVNNTETGLNAELDALGVAFSNPE